MAIIGLPFSDPGGRFHSVHSLARPRVFASLRGPDCINSARPARFNFVIARVWLLLVSVAEAPENFPAARQAPLKTQPEALE